MLVRVKVGIGLPNCRNQIAIVTIFTPALESLQRGRATNIVFYVFVSVVGIVEERD